MENETPLIEVKANVDPKTIPDESKMRSYFDRITRLEDEKTEIQRDINEIYSEAKSSGFNTKAMKQVFKLRKMMPADRAETEFLRAEYKKMLGIEE